MKTPRISTAPGEDDFHDSSLVDFQISPQLNEVRAVLSTPDAMGLEGLWMITFRGVMRLEYETVGDGELGGAGLPLEIYSVYHVPESKERGRWVQRLLHMGVPRTEAERVCHVVLASSFARGWGDREDLEGLQVICRDVVVERAPGDYRGSEFKRPRIEADE
jgi:hypothetical protein